MEISSIANTPTVNFQEGPKKTGKTTKGVANTNSSIASSSTSQNWFKKMMNGIATPFRAIGNAFYKAINWIIENLFCCFMKTPSLKTLIGKLEKVENAKDEASFKDATKDISTRDLKAMFNHLADNEEAKIKENTDQNGKLTAAAKQELAEYQKGRKKLCDQYVESMQKGFKESFGKVTFSTELAHLKGLQNEIEAKKQAKQTQA